MKKKNNKVLLITMFISLFGLLCCISIFHFVKYNTRFTHNSKINGIDVTMMTIEDTSELFRSLDGKNITIIDEFSSIEIPLKEIAKINIQENDLYNIFSQTNTPLYKLIGRNLGTNDYNTYFSIDVDTNLLTTKLCDFVQSGDRKNGQNAYIYYDDSIGEYLVENESIGSSVDLDVLVSNVKGYLVENYRQDNNEYCIDYTKKDEIYIKPEITSNDLMEECDNINDAFKSSTFNICFHGENIPVDSSKLVDWANKDVNGLPIIENGNISYSIEKITNDLQEYAKSYDTQGNGVELLNHDGEIIEIIDKKFGWKVDIDATTNAILENLANKNSENLNVVFQTSGFPNDEFPKTYVEVDTKQQHLYYYIDGELVFDSDVVTGRLGKSETNHGIHQVQFKQKNRTLRGANYTSFVHYWMRFDDDAEGFHDATWRSKFGGNIYEYDGSHGCVNMPLQKAKELYDILDVGTYVFIY